MKGKQISAAVAALALSCVMWSPSALAVEFQGTPALIYRMEEDGIALEVEGLQAGESVYAVQLTLELNGAHPDVGLIPWESYVETENKVTVSEEKTSLSIYLDAQAPINHETELRLGCLQLKEAGSLPGEAQLTLLDRDLNRTDTTVRVKEGGSSGGGSSGGAGRPSESAKVEQTGQGRVTISPARASAGTKVTITATPDPGSKVASVIVTDKNGNPVQVTAEGGDQFTFLQPKNGPVQIRVDFQEAVAPKDLPFADIQKTDWYYEAVSYVYQKGLMTGTAAETFDPERTTTRGMIVTVLHRMEGAPTAEGTGFQDVTAGAYYTDAVLWASAHGIVNGYGNGSFGPDDPINREQMATILYRYAACKGYDVSERAELISFRDAGQISGYATEAMSWANACGLIQGLGDGTLSPEGSATRAQIAAILMRFETNIVK